MEDAGKGAPRATVTSAVINDDIDFEAEAQSRGMELVSSTQVGGVELSLMFASQRSNIVLRSVIVLPITIVGGYDTGFSHYKYVPKYNNLL